jgi:hypothetical protein
MTVPEHTWSEITGTCKQNEAPLKSYPDAGRLSARGEWPKVNSLGAIRAC